MVINILRSHAVTWVCIGCFLVGSNAIHAQETTQKPFWKHYSFYLDGGAILFLKGTTTARGATTLFPMHVSWFPWPVVALGWKWTAALGRRVYGQLHFYYSSTHVLHAMVHWTCLIIPGTRFSLGYVNSKDMLFTLGLGTKEFIKLHGSLAVDIPLSNHFFLSLEASYPFDRVSLGGPATLLRITTQLGYKW